MKKALALVLAVVMLIGLVAVSASADGNAVFTLTADKTEYAPEDVVTVQLKLTTNPGINTGVLSLKADTGLTYTSGAKGDIADFGIVIGKTGGVTFDVDEGESTATGLLATYTFTVADNANGSYKITLSLKSDDEDNLLDGDDDNVGFSCSPLEIIVKGACEHTNRADPVEENKVDSTCAKEGSYDEVVYCADCGEELSRTPKSIDKKAHTSGEAKKENEVAATCKEAGSYDEVVYCSVCKEELSRTKKTVDKIDHTPGEAQRENEVAATCKEAGSYDEVVYCSVCKEELSRENKTIEKLTTHTKDESLDDITKAPSCTEKGEVKHTCGVCGATWTEELPELGHTPKAAVEENVVDSTCKETGSYDEVIYCEKCEEEISRTPKTIDKKAHTPGEAQRENEVAATCAKEGSYDEVVYCSVCKEELSRDTKTIDKLTTHTPGEAQRENEVAATCKAEGSYDEVVYCEVCEAELSRDNKTIPVDPAAHGETEVKEAKEATCKEDGYTGDKVCKLCEEVAEKGEVIPAAHGETEIRDAKEATCTEEGYTGDTYCKVCGEKIADGEKTEKAAHTPGEPEETVTKEATETEDGEKTITTKCTACGETIEEKKEPIPATGKEKPEDKPEEKYSSTPSTGDRAMILVWLGILGISGAALGVLSKKRKYSVK